MTMSVSYNTFTMKIMYKNVVETCNIHGIWEYKMQNYKLSDDADGFSIDSFP